MPSNRWAFLEVDGPVLGAKSRPYLPGPKLVNLMGGFERSGHSNKDGTS